MDHTQRFSGMAEDYEAGRPDYAAGLFEWLYGEAGLSAPSVIADVGAGTGKFARQLLERGSTVFCVEPNGDMRDRAERELGRYGGFRGVNGTAEQTGMADHSVDAVTAAQAFHWFDGRGFQAECRRILKEGGPVFLVWNVRGLEDGLNRRSEELFSEYCPGFSGFSGGMKKGDRRIREFFCGAYEYREFDHPLTYGREAFIRRCLSGSYSLKKGDERYGEYLEALSRLFGEYEKGGKVTMANRTAVYWGRLE